MEHLIKSKLLSMSNLEFNQFLSQFVTIIGRKIFINLLFDHCTESAPTINGYNHILNSSQSFKLIDTLPILSSIISRRASPSSSPDISINLSPSQSGFKHQQQNNKQFASRLNLDNVNKTKYAQNENHNKVIPKSESNDNNNQHNIYNLPTSLLSNFASYLECKSYFSFARTCTKIYISSHCPLTLQHLNLKQIPTSQSLTRFKWIKSLNMNIKHFNSQISNNNKYVWSKSNCIETLKLSNLMGTEQDMATFMNNNYIMFNANYRRKYSLTPNPIQNNYFKFPNNFTNNLSMSKIVRKQNNSQKIKSYLRTLALANFGTNLCGYNTILFCKLLTQFPMIKRLILWDIHLSNKGQLQYLLHSEHLDKEIFPNLTELVCTYNVNKELTQQLIYSLGHKLKSLALWQVNDIKINQTKGFPNLEELVLFIHGFSQILNTLKSAKIHNLKRVKLSNNDQKMMKQCIEWFLNKSKHPKLERLQINVQCKYLKYVMDKVYDNIKTKRDKLVVGFQCNWSQDIIQLLDEMVVKLRDILMENTSDFALNLKIENVRRYSHGIMLNTNDDIWLNTVEIWMNKLNLMETNNEFMTIYEFKTVRNTDIFSFTVANKECKIEGYGYSFIDLL